MTQRFKITAPVEHVIGTVAGVTFNDSVGETDNPGAVAYFKRHGYKVEELKTEPAPADDALDGPELPKKSATTEVWRAYAVEHGGMTADEAAAMSRDQLAARFHTETEGAGQ